MISAPQQLRTPRATNVQHRRWALNEWLAAALRPRVAANA